MDSLWAALIAPQAPRPGEAGRRRGTTALLRFASRPAPKGGNVHAGGGPAAAGRALSTERRASDCRYDRPILSQLDVPPSDPAAALALPRPRQQNPRSLAHLNPARTFVLSTIGTARSRPRAPAEARRQSRKSQLGRELVALQLNHPLLTPSLLRWGVNSFGRIRRAIGTKPLPAIHICVKPSFATPPAKGEKPKTTSVSWKQNPSQYAAPVAEYRR